MPGTRRAWQTRTAAIDSAAWWRSCRAVVVAEQVTQVLFVGIAFGDELDRLGLLVVAQYQPNLAPILKEVLLQQGHDAIAEDVGQFFKAGLAIIHIRQSREIGVAML